MYQSLYRKYRPSNFDEVVGQEVPVKILKNAIKNNRIAHAYIFAGIRGTGKTSIAKIFAKTVNCLDPVEMKPCGKCVVCTQSNNTDIVEIDAASNNGVDEIRELRDKIALVPSISKYKVYIIDEVHMLSTSAFNALLKTLEEPPQHAIFILATTEVHKIPLTILSRCQRLDFKSITIENIIKRLEYICSKEEIKISEEATKEIARLANGGMRDAISLLEQVWAYSDDITIEDVHKMNGTLTKEEIKELIQAILSNQVQKCFELVEKYEEKNVDFAKLVDEIMYFIRNLIFFKITNEEIDDSYYNKTDYEDIKELTDVKRLINFIKKVNAASNEIKVVSNKKTIFEMLIISCIDMKEDESKISSEAQVKAVDSVAHPSQAFVNKIKSEFEKSVKSQIKEEKNENPKPATDLENDINKIKELRINNTLAEFDKRILTTLQKKIEVIHDFIIDLQYGNIASLILDGQLKAASREYMLFVFEEKMQSLKFNTKINEIEELIQIALSNNYKVISINSDEWETVKQEFNSKTKKYVKTAESEEIEKIIKNLNNSGKDFLEENFSDIISYE